MPIRKFKTDKSALFIRGSITTKKDKEESDRNAEESNKKSIIDKTQLIFTFLMFCVALGQAILFVWQLRLMEKATKDSETAAVAAKDSVNVARDTLIASQRPWISARISLVKKLRWDKNGAMRYEVHYVLKNVGHSPALHVMPRFGLYLAIPLDRLTSAQKYLCENSNTEMSGYTIFPGEELDASIGTEGGPNYSDVNLWHDLVKDEGSANYMPVALVGCIGYRSSLQSELLQTGYISSFWQIHVGEDNVAPAPEFFFQQGVVGSSIVK